MAFFGVRATEDGLAPSSGGGCVAERLSRLIGALPRTAPIVILVHGFKFAPGHRPGPHNPKPRDPFELIYAFDPSAACRRAVSWPAGLGFTPHGADDGLCIGFGWPALPSARGAAAAMREFPDIYLRAGLVSGELAKLIDMIARLAPGRPVDILCHSLGARVALSALPRISRGAVPGRMILLGAAEYASVAAARLGETRHPPEIYNVIARENRFYDQLFEWSAPRLPRRSPVIGRLGEPLPGAVTIRIDDPAVGARLAAMGCALDSSARNHGHWGFYRREGTLALYAAILRDRDRWSLPELRRGLAGDAAPASRRPNRRNPRAVPASIFGSGGRAGTA